jgi:hypothetical protein
MAKLLSGKRTDFLINTNMTSVCVITPTAHSVVDIGSLTSENISTNCAANDVVLVAFSSIFVLFHTETE